MHAERRLPPVRAERDYIYRHIHPNGRIIGKPGRRQRTSSEQLATASLGKPSEVIVFHDVVEDRKKPALLSTQRQRSRASQASGVQGVTQDDGEENDSSGFGYAARDGEMAQGRPDARGLQEAVLEDSEEAIASIDRLRPNSMVVDGQHLKKLERQLMEGYNLKQLTRYLLLSLGRRAEEEVAKPESTDSDKVQVTSWQPGRTPFEQRVGRVSLEKRGRGKSKPSVAKQILRLVWQLTTDAEAQELGELELYVRAWQLSLLFDVNQDGKPVKEFFIDSPLLIRKSDVRPYKAENVVRITARKGDAVEIANRLQEGLSRVYCDELDLTVFTPLLGRPGWSNTLAELFTPQDLHFVSQRTKSTFAHHGDGKLGIFSVNETAVVSVHAKRLLLGLLDLPSPTVRLTWNEADLDGEDAVLNTVLECFGNSTAGRVSTHERPSSLSITGQIQTSHPLSRNAKEARQNRSSEVMVQRKSWTLILPMGGK